MSKPPPSIVEADAAIAKHVGIVDIELAGDCFLPAIALSRVRRIAGKFWRAIGIRCDDMMTE
ncbi:hypothetical protein [Microcoleus sp. K5-D4]|uniref:hypothetical protein n=1 Tax=Microcoleus sp. K5-D4 TaxID=2818801 RepID=UPI002FD2C2C3